MWIPGKLSQTLQSNKCLCVCVVLKQMGIGNPGRWKLGPFLVILLSYSHTGMSKLLSYPFSRHQVCLLPCQNNTLRARRESLKMLGGAHPMHGKVVIHQHRALYDAENRIPENRTPYLDGRWRWFCGHYSPQSCGSWLNARSKNTGYNPQGFPHPGGSNLVDTCGGVLEVGIML